MTADSERGPARLNAASPKATSMPKAPIATTGLDKSRPRGRLQPIPGRAPAPAPCALSRTALQRDWARGPHGRPGSPAALRPLFAEFAGSYDADVARPPRTAPALPLGPIENGAGWG